MVICMPTRASNNSSYDGITTSQASDQFVSARIRQRRSAHWLGGTASVALATLDSPEVEGAPLMSVFTVIGGAA